MPENVSHNLVCTKTFGRAVYMYMFVCPELIDESRRPNGELWHAEIFSSLERKFTRYDGVMT